MEEFITSTEALRRTPWQPRQLRDRRSRSRPAAADRRSVGSAAMATAAAAAEAGHDGDEFLRRLREAGL